MSDQVVQITINVTDANAAEAVQQVVAQLNALGPAGEAAGAKAGEGLDQVETHAISAREQVRLLSEEMGLRVPRAMQSVIANSQMMSAAIGAIAPAMIAIGGVDILMHLGESAYGAYQKFVLLKESFADSNAAIEKLGSATEAAMDRASEATEKYIRLTQGARAADEWKLTGLQSTGIGIPLYKDEGFQKSPDAMKGDIEKITGESVMPKDLPEAIAKLQAYEDIAKGTAAYMQKLHDTPLPSDPYSNNPTYFRQTQVDEQQQIVKNADTVLSYLRAQQDAFAKETKAQAAQIGKDKPGTPEAQEAIQKEKEKNDAILSLEDSARNALLSGDALLEAQREKAIDDFVRKYGQSRDALLAIDAEYAHKESDLWKQQADEAHKAMRVAQQGADQQAHTGVGSIQFELSESLGDIDKKQAGGMQPGYAKDLRDAAQQTADTKILAAQQEFENQMAQIGTHADDQQIQGYARIAENAAQAAKKIQDDWQALADKVGASSTTAVDAHKKADAEIVAVDQNMFREMEQLHQKTMEQIAKEEEQTARLSLAPWQQAQLRIADDYQDRVRKIEDAEAQQDAALNADMQTHSDHFLMDQQAQVMAAKDANAEMLAARQLMNAQMQQADEETRDKLASGLQSLFSNPAQFFEKRAMDTAFQLMANEMLSTFKSSTPTGGLLQYMFGMAPQMSTSTNPLDAMGSALGMGGHGMAGLSTATSPGAIQFQQGASTFSISTTAFSTAVTQFASAAGMMSVRGGIGGVGSGGGGFSMPGLGGAGVSTSSGSGLDLGDLAGGGSAASAMMMPGLSTSAGMTGAMGGTFDNSMMMPGLNSIQMDSTLGGAASSGAKELGAGAGIAGGALMAGTSILSAYQNSNPLAGAAGGAMGGAEIGMAVGGPVGAAIGALVGGVGGLLAGIFGDKGRGQAEGLDVNTIQPELTKDMQDYEAGRSGYNSIASALNSMEISAQNQTQQMGSGARSYFNSNIQPEIQAVLSSLQKQERGGRSAITLSAAQYHDGGWTGDFGDLATSDTEGFVHTMANEFVVNPMAAAAHAPILQAMNSGTNFAYSNNVQPRMPGSPGGGANVQLTIQALDSKSVAQWAAGGGGLALMSALNQANRQYGGMGRG